MNAKTDLKNAGLRRAATLTAATALLVGVTGGVAAADPDPTTKPTVAVSELLLNSSDFPDGYIVVPGAQQRLANELGADPMSLVSSAKVSPPECKNVISAASSTDQGNSNTVAGLNDKDKKTLTESLVAKDSDVDTLKVGLLKLCSDVTIEANDPRGGVVNVRAITKEVATDKQKATFEIALDGTRTKGADSFPINQKVLFGVASLRGYTVAVQGAKLGGDADRGEFDSFFSKSVKKIQDAK